MSTLPPLLAHIPSLSHFQSYPVKYQNTNLTHSQPITEVTSNDIACNGGPNPTQSTSTVITVQAGSTAKLTWRHTLTSGSNDIIDASHKGPVMAYMKKVSDAKSDPGYGSGWFKIAEDGLHPDGTWAVDTMIANKGKVTFNIPTCLEDGQYLLRHEIIGTCSSRPGRSYYLCREC